MTLEESKKWFKHIHKEKAHNNGVLAFHELNNNGLISSGYDHLIKIWKISQNELSQIQTLKEHTNVVFQIIPFPEGCFASCSWDGTLHVWENNMTLSLTKTMHLSEHIRGIIKLRKQDMLVSCGYFPKTGISFWNTINQSHLMNLQNYCISWHNHIIELSNGIIALSSREPPYPIVIIDCLTYQVVKQLVSKNLININSSLCLFNEQSFIYMSKENFLLISNTHYSKIFSSKEKKMNIDYGGIIVIREGKYFAVQNGKQIEILEAF